MLTAVKGHRSGTPFFSSPRGSRRERSVSDAVVLVITALAVAVTGLASIPPSGFESAVIDLIDAVPSWLDFLWRLGLMVLCAWVLGVVYVAAARRRGDVLFDIGAAALLGFGLSSLAARRLNGAWPDLNTVFTGGSIGSVPFGTLVIAAAAGYAAAPHLATPYRRFGRASVLVGVVGAVLLGSTTPIGGILSILVGAATAALVHVALGSSAGRPTLSEVADAMRELGTDMTGLTELPHRRGGPLLATGVDGFGHQMRVEVYGRDARDAQLLLRTWRSLWTRGAAIGARSREQYVEREGFVTLLAASRSLVVPEVLVAGRTRRGDALIAVRDASTPLSECSRADVVGSLSAVWESVRSLHAAGMVHGALEPDTFGVGDDRAIVLRDLGPVSLSTDEAARMQDLAQLVTATSVLVGIERCVVVAGEFLDADGVRRVLPYLQAAALSAPLRRALKEANVDSEALRSALGAVVDVEVPELVKLRRVSPRSLGTAALLALVAWVLITQLSSVDLSELWHEISGATPIWVVGALLMAQVVFAPQAVATRGATPTPVALGPLAMLQASVAFVALAVPSTAGRLALDIRFFQRQGLPAASAVSISAIDSFSGFLVQVSLLVATLVLGVGDVELSFQRSTQGSSVDLALVLGVLAGVAVLLGVLAVSLPRIRRRIVERVRPVLAQVRDTATSLRRPAKLLELFGGNLVAQLLFATTLGMCLKAFGAEADLATLVVVYVAAALFGGLMPVPGGIGVMEGALMTGLIAAGIPTTTASAAALLFRAVTFYLPPLWGWLAMAWLRRRDYL